MFRDLIGMLKDMGRVMFVIVGLGLILYLVIGAVQCHGFAAPVPPERPLASEDLPGTWEYRWGSMRNGVIVFEADGFYYSRHDDQGTEARYCGRWELDRGVLTLHERSCCSCATGYTDYPVKLSYSRRGFAAGRYGETVVEISKRP